MTSESLGFDPYEAVLTDLRGKRDQLDQTIKLLEAQRGSGAPSLGVAANHAYYVKPDMVAGVPVYDTDYFSTYA